MRDWPPFADGGVPPCRNRGKNEKGEGANPRSEGVAGERRGRGVRNWVGVRQRTKREKLADVAPRPAGCN